jgi:hypothetical protein
MTSSRLACDEKQKAHEELLLAIAGRQNWP